MAISKDKRHVPPPVIRSCAVPRTPPSPARRSKRQTQRWPGLETKTSRAGSASRAIMRTAMALSSRRAAAGRTPCPASASSYRKQQRAQALRAAQRCAVAKQANFAPCVFSGPVKMNARYAPMPSLPPCNTRHTHSGSQKHVHRSCLDKWRVTQTNNMCFTHCTTYVTLVAARLDLAPRRRHRQKLPGAGPQSVALVGSNPALCTRVTLRRPSSARAMIRR